MYRGKEKRDYPIPRIAQQVEIISSLTNLCLRYAAMYSLELAPSGLENHNKECCRSKKKISLKKEETLANPLVKNENGSSSKNIDQSNEDKSVHFSSVDVRDYSICLGDNPSVSRGAPISLDWGYDKEQTYGIESYECRRSEARRNEEELKIPSLQRIQLLKGLGYSRGEINEQTKKTEQDKQRRFRTRRRIDREDRVKAFVRNNCILNTFRKMLSKPTLGKNKTLCVGGSLQEFEPESDGVTLESSISSTKSTITATED